MIQELMTGRRALSTKDKVLRPSHSLGNPARFVSLCANIGETTASSFIIVEGEEVGHGIDRTLSEGSSELGRGVEVVPF
jgi:hypothetical protein